MPVDTAVVVLEETLLDETSQCEWRDFTTDESLCDKEATWCCPCPGCNQRPLLCDEHHDLCLTYDVVWCGVCLTTRTVEEMTRGWFRI